MNRDNRPNPATGSNPFVRMAAMTAAAATAPLAWLAYSKYFVDHEENLRPAIDAPRHTIDTNDAGTISYYADDTVKGRPLVLIHSVNAAASAFEMAPLFDHYRKTRRVIAVDLPGFGFSDRADRAYTPETFAHAILHLLRNVSPARGGADVVALSLSSEFVARAVVEAPELFHSVTLVSPTGFASAAKKPTLEALGRGRVNSLRRKVLEFPLWSQAVFDLLVSRPSLEYYTNKVFVGAPEGSLIDYQYATAHRPGARFAPLSFLSGDLFTPRVREDYYAKMTMPTLVVYDRDGFVTFDELPGFAASMPNWQLERVAPTRGMPQFERTDETCAALERFWFPNQADGSAEHGDPSASNGHAHSVH